MKAFLRYTAAACTALLSWWQMHLHASFGALGIALAGLGTAAIYLTLRGSRFGYWFGLILGLGFGAEVTLRLGGDAFHAASPLIGWSLALAVCSFTLLRTSREKSDKPPQYERPW